MCKAVMSRMQRFFHRDDGAALAEYALLLALIAVICLAAITLLGQEISSFFSSLAGQM